MPSWVKDGYDEYAKRLPKDFVPKLIELPLGNRSKNSNVANAKKSEGESMLVALDQLPRGTHVVALEVQGRAISTEGLAKRIENLQAEAKGLCLLVGGPDGLSEPCVQRASEKWSLSALTLPHPLVRVLIIEQLYRAWTILQRHPYHK